MVAVGDSMMASLSEAIFASVKPLAAVPDMCPVILIVPPMNDNTPSAKHLENLFICCPLKNGAFPIPASTTRDGYRSLAQLDITPIVSVAGALSRESMPHWFTVASSQIAIPHL